MSSGRDDDALNWDGDDDPTLDVRAARAGDPGSPGRAEPSATEAETELAVSSDLPAGFTPVGRGSEAYEPSGSVNDAARPPAATAVESASMGNVELISLGVLGGFAALYAVGWLIGGLRLQGTAEFLVAPLAYQVSLWLAVLAPLAWFATVLVLTRDLRRWVRFVWLVGGVVLLVPWPFIMVGAIGQ